MSDQTSFSRRQALKFLASAPLLPLGASSALLAACGIVPTKSASAEYVGTSFTPMAAPTLTEAAAMATTAIGSTLNVHYGDNSTQHYKLAYQSFFITGQQVPDGKGGTVLSGGYFDIHNKAIIDRSIAGKERQFFSDSPDGTSLLSLPNPTVTGIKGKAVFAVVQFEYLTRDQLGAATGKNNAYGTLPSPIAVLTLDQDQSTGKL
ncbi:MAG: alkaline phosphatase, partial [Pseudomonadota bacterium]